MIKLYLWNPNIMAGQNVERDMASPPFLLTVSESVGFECHGEPNVDVPLALTTPPLAMPGATSLGGVE